MVACCSATHRCLVLRGCSCLFLPVCSCRPAPLASSRIASPFPSRLCSSFGQVLKYSLRLSTIVGGNCGIHPSGFSTFINPPPISRDIPRLLLPLLEARSRTALISATIFSFALGNRLLSLFVRVDSALLFAFGSGCCHSLSGVDGIFAILSILFLLRFSSGRN